MYFDDQINYIVHCEWHEWIIADCSMSCGGGTRTRTRTIKQTAEHGGDECPDKNVTGLPESCNVQECPGNKNGQYYLLSLFGLACSLTILSTKHLPLSKLRMERMENWSLLCDMWGWLENK